MSEGPLVGSVLELDVGPPAHGGSCVARADGRVVFVRHALPGERVRAVVTEDAKAAYLRADAVDVLSAHPDRVLPPCQYARPGACGGCDWQHASGALQRELKLEIIREQFRRIAALDVTELLQSVDELPGGLLGWRTRITYATTADDRLGLHKHRSSEVHPVDRCLIGAAGVGDTTALEQSWPGLSGVEVVRGADSEITVIAHRPGPGRHARGRRPPDRLSVVCGPDAIAVSVLGRPMSVAAGGFWQVHPAAADAYARAVVELARLAPGESVLELFCGAGALTAALADAVGSRGSVLAVESNAAAVQDASRNLADLPQVTLQRARVTLELLADVGVHPDVVVLDPPRSGLGRDAMAALLGLGPRGIVYVACDPAALARDVHVAVAAGWRLAELRAFDAFPMTAHIECLALLVPGSA